MNATGNIPPERLPLTRFSPDGPVPLIMLAGVVLFAVSAAVTAGEAATPAHEPPSSRPTGGNLHTEIGPGTTPNAAAQVPLIGTGRSLPADDLEDTGPSPARGGRKGIGPHGPSPTLTAVVGGQTYELVPGESKWLQRDDTVVKTFDFKPGVKPEGIATGLSTKPIVLCEGGYNSGLQFTTPDLTGQESGLPTQIPPGWQLCYAIVRYEAIVYSVPATEGPWVPLLMGRERYFSLGTEFNPFYHPAKGTVRKGSTEGEFLETIQPFFAYHEGGEVDAYVVQANAVKPWYFAYPIDNSGKPTTLRFTFGLGVGAPDENLDSLTTYNLVYNIPTRPSGPKSYFVQSSKSPISLEVYREGKSLVMVNVFGGPVLVWIGVQPGEHAPKLGIEHIRDGKVRISYVGDGTKVVLQGASDPSGPWVDLGEAEVAPVGQERAREIEMTTTPGYFRSMRVP